MIGVYKLIVDHISNLTYSGSVAFSYKKITLRQCFVAYINIKKVDAEKTSYKTL